MRRTRLAAIVLVGVLAASARLAHSQAAEPKSGEKYALLVGVRQYDSPELRELSYAEADVAELANVLLGQGYRPENVALMTLTKGAENVRRLPMGGRIRRELALLLQDRKPADTVFVALAGHGVRPRGSRSSYFCPVDADIDDLGTLVSLDELYKALEKCGAGFKLLLVDACRNDPLTKNTRARATVKLESTTRPEVPEPPGGVIALFSCSAGEVAFEDASLRHGVFFNYVIEGLRGKAARGTGGRVTLPLLEDYVKDNVERFVRDKFGVRQMPERRGREAGSVTLAEVREVTNGLGMKLRLIPAGEFLMGSPNSDKDAADDEKPRHTVRITRPFYLGATEVTVGQFRRVADSAGIRTDAERDGKGGMGMDELTKVFRQDTKYSWRNPGFSQGDDHPVVNVSWNDAVAFCNALSELDGLQPYYRFGAERPTGGEGYRLPTEAEWEYACRAGTTTLYQGGDDPEMLVWAGNVADATVKQTYPRWTTLAARDGYVHTAPVGRFRANGFGLYDLHGNVFEWCWDGYQADYYKGSPGADPSGPLQGAGKVGRGGCWSSIPRDVRPARRYGFATDGRGADLGFRVARNQSGR